MEEGQKFSKKWEEHYIKSHKKCEDWGGGAFKKGCEIIFEWDLWATDSFCCTTKSTGGNTNVSMRANLGCTKDTAARLGHQRCHP